MRKMNPRKTSFIQKVNEISGQNAGTCFQCGTCSGSCPNWDKADLLPRQIMRRVQMGMEQDACVSRMPWICASCLNCSVRCPRGIDVARVMEALRLLSLRANIDYVDPNEIPAETIAELPQIALISSFRKHTG